MKGLNRLLKPTFYSTLGLILYGSTIFVIYTDFFGQDNMQWLASVALDQYQSLGGDMDRFELIAVKGVDKSTSKPASTLIATASLDENSASEKTVEQAEVEEKTDNTIGYKEYVNPAVYSSINLRYDGRVHRIEDSEVRAILGHKQYLDEAKESFDQNGKPLIRTIISEEFEPFHYDKKIIQNNEDGILQEKIRGFEYYESDYGPDIDDTVDEVIRVIQTRLNLNFGNQDYITVKNFEHPGTNGEYSNDKYIELDHSKQVIYAWENGELYKKWDSSGFYDEYAVFGVFDIKNKSVKAWSPIAEKWMPYWMAFYYEKKQAAWFGLHELVWWYDAQGNIIEESSDSIGFKKSGGCVRLDRGQMVELYDWTEVGIHFLIHE